MSRAAKMTGVQVKWEFDKNKHAIRAFALNFDPPDTAVILSDAARLVSVLREADLLLKVDVLRLCPPCQPFTPTSTNRGMSSRGEERKQCIDANVPGLKRPNQEFPLSG